MRYSASVRVISRKALRQFWTRHPDARMPLLRWHQVMRLSTFRNFGALRAVFPTADKVQDWIVFNIGGNKYRLVATIHFNRERVYIRHVLTHQEYDKGSWKQ